MKQVAAQVRISMVQTYKWQTHFWPLALLLSRGKDEVAVPTVVLLTFDEGHLIVKHEDLWWGQPTTSTTPVLEHVHSSIKKVNGKLWQAYGHRSYPDERSSS